MDLERDSTRLIPLSTLRNRKTRKPMKILPTLCALALILGLAPLAQAQNGGVAVLDIDKVAQELGVDQSVLTELKQIETNLNSQLAQVRTNLQSQMNQLEARAGQQRTPEIQAQLVQANRKLNADFGAVRAQAQSQLTTARVQKINEFREKLRPIALEAAKAKGLQVVMTLSPNLYAHDDSIDITEEVIKRAKDAGIQEEVGAPAPAPAPESSETEAPATPTEAAPATDTEGAADQ